jgi:hypothetical protein
MAINENKQVKTNSDRASGSDPNSSSLVAMLIVGLVLIVVGAIAVMTFV